MGPPHIEKCPFHRDLRRIIEPPQTTNATTAMRRCGGSGSPLNEGDLPPRRCGAPEGNTAHELGCDRACPGRVVVYLKTNPARLSQAARSRPWGLFFYPPPRGQRTQSWRAQRMRASNCGPFLRSRSILGCCAVKLKHGSNARRDADHWHLAGIPTAPVNVRFRG